MKSDKSVHGRGAVGEGTVADGIAVGKASAGYASPAREVPTAVTSNAAQTLSLFTRKLHNLDHRLRPACRASYQRRKRARWLTRDHRENLSCVAAEPQQIPGWLTASH